MLDYLMNMEQDFTLFAPVDKAFTSPDHKFVSTALFVNDRRL